MNRWPLCERIRDCVIAYFFLIYVLDFDLGEGDGFDFGVSEKREELRVLILVFTRELCFVLR